MNRALRAGRSRGWIELRQSVTNGGDLLNHALWPVLMLVTLYFLRDRTLVPTILGMNTAMAMVSMSQHLTADREDGSLRRARATPYGVVGLLSGKLISVSGGLVLDLALFLVPALFLVDGLALGRPATWAQLTGVLLLGLMATLPAGAVLGSLFGTARGQSLLLLPVLGLIAISGVFFPLASLPGWLQGVAQVFPIYWLGLGMRSALLPDFGAATHYLPIIGVLSAWAVAGLLLAPIALRRAGAWK